MHSQGGWVNELVEEGVRDLLKEYQNEGGETSEE